MMGKRSKKQEAVQTPQLTELDIEFKVTIQEIHCRTGTLCDKRSQTFSFSLDDDFEKAADWLKSGDAYTVFEDLSGEIEAFLDAASEDTQ
ncbi:hypothetical protein [Sphingobium baderi]|uniref:hypothetical protein n=1 Tax=Sphingobium baderi TaxID=1332080 RepID=UPI002B409CB1|nr:hypothetical protein [Sphingobium baderi]WRD77823.1 hypothetical protein QQ987_06915 [Sphingobium baderi]